MQAFSAAVGWGTVELPARVEVGVRRSRLAGQQRFNNVGVMTLDHMWNHETFLASTPSLNVVYLPAERRLLEPRQQGIDLNQLSEAVSHQKNVESWHTVANYGRLDDQEFEDFAKALCVAASLPAEPGPEVSAPAEARVEWEGFRTTVNALLFPKELLGLTRSHPDQLRIRTAAGDIHPLRDLSSGERQSLIIMSRVLRSGTGTPLVMIDEPDAYLHPHLSKRLIMALENGVGEAGQLIVATHSPAILDGVPPSAILRLQYDGPPHPVADETERLELYRSAGFRSSALTQSDLLLITEGSTDVSLLNLAIPALSGASLRPAGGKAQVLREVEQLRPFELPIIGVVDRDLGLSPVPASISADIFIWPTADIEGVYLSNEASLQNMIDHGFIKSEYRSVGQLRDLIARLCMAQRENFLAETARAKAVLVSGYEWPSPKGEGALDRLRAAVADATPITSAQLESAVAEATDVWDGAADDLLQIVRGKYILGAFVSEASEMRSGRALLEAVARQRPPIPAIDDLTKLVVDRIEQAL